MRWRSTTTARSSSCPTLSRRKSEGAAGDEPAACVVLSGRQRRRGHRRRRGRRGDLALVDPVPNEIIGRGVDEGGNRGEVPDRLDASGEIRRGDGGRARTVRA